MSGRSCSRSSSGAVSINDRIWLMHCVRALTAEFLGTFNARNASIRPSPRLGTATRSPAKAARAAASASTGSDLPRRRRRRRSGRGTSTTSTSRTARNRFNPAPYEPVPSTPTRTSSPCDCIQRSNARCPDRSFENERVPKTQPTESTTTATCSSRCVSTPPTTPTAVSTMMDIAITFLSSVMARTATERGQHSDGASGQAPIKSLPRAGNVPEWVPHETVDRSLQRPNGQ